MITNRGRTRDWHHKLPAIFERGSPSWRGRSRICRNGTSPPECQLMYKSLDHITAFQHARLVGPPQSGIHHSGTVPGQGSPDSDVANGRGPASLEHDCCSGDEYAEEGGIGPKRDGVAKARVPADERECTFRAGTRWHRHRSISEGRFRRYSRR